MNRNGIIALLCGATLMYAFFHFVFGVEAFTLFQVFFIKVFAIAKGFIARLSWEVVYIFTANFFKRAAVKFVAVQVPMFFVMPILTVLMLRPETKRRLKKRLSIVKVTVGRWYRTCVYWYEKWFGKSAVVVFVGSCVFAIFTFILSMYAFGFEFFLWLGSWSWVSAAWRTISSFFGGIFGSFGGLVRNFLFRFPAVGAILAFFGRFWKLRIAPLVPSVEYKRKRALKQSLKKARTTREHGFAVYLRYERMREHRKERRRNRRYRRQERLRRLRNERMKRSLRRMMLAAEAGLLHRDRSSLCMVTYQQQLPTSLLSSTECLYLHAFVGAAPQSVWCWQPRRIEEGATDKAVSSYR